MLSVINYLLPRDSNSRLITATQDIRAAKLSQKQNRPLENTQLSRSLETRILELQNLTDLVDGYKGKKWTAAQVLEIYSMKCLQVDKHFNLIGEFMFDEAKERAKYLDNYFTENGKLFGPLHGVPIVLSDECIIAGVGTTKLN